MPLRFFSAARGVHITLSRFRVKRLFSLFSVRFCLHVLGLPPAFNLSHDQTLQFKSLMLNELNFVMNYVFTLETWYSFFVLRR
ncbi:hypothetical protein DW282_19425 [Salmonella enterica subsp. enterica]|nr:hypothetical protein DW282_19425 [Salmonella enterica subsp. enterica]